jgi:outer membrane protein assembly factor BamA
VATVFEDVPLPDERRQYSSLGVSGEYDTRTSTTYPMDGFYCTARLRRYADWLGSASEYTKIKIEVNRYLLQNSIDVLALRGCVEAALGTVPFEAQTVVGAGKDIRGYSSGKFRGDQVYSLQGEYRWNFAPPFGAVGFLGFSLPITQGEQARFADILPGLGAGFRYTMVPEIHANVGLDVAVGRDDWGLYFRIAEAF